MSHFINLAVYTTLIKKIWKTTKTKED